MEELIRRLSILLDDLERGNVIDTNVGRQQIRINGMRDLLVAMEDRVNVIRLRSLVHHRGVEAEQMAKSLWEKA